MKIICGSRQSGKTAKLIKLIAETDGYIVCSNHRECYRTAELARKLGYEIRFPLSWEEFLKGQYRLYGDFNPSIAIDNADLLLQKPRQNAPDFNQGMNGGSVVETI